MTHAWRDNGPAWSLSLLFAGAIKLAYSRVGPDELTWILAPTQRLVTLMTGIELAYEAGYGYVSLGERLVIAKSCAGVNYLIAVFGMLAFLAVPAASGHRAKLARVALAAGTAYGVAVLVNSIRIAFGIVLRDAELGGTGSGAARVHRLAGIVVYVLSLIVVHEIARRFLPGCAGSGFGTPILWYGLVTLALPLANGALFERPALFLEHASWLALVLLGLHGLAVWRPVPRAVSFLNGTLPASRVVGQRVRHSAREDTDGAFTAERDDDGGYRSEAATPCGPGLGAAASGSL